MLILQLPSGKTGVGEIIVKNYGFTQMSDVTQNRSLKAKCTNLSSPVQKGASAFPYICALEILFHY